MFSRRPDPRFNRGRIATTAGTSSPPPVTPLTILGADCLQWCRADIGVTIGTGVSAWADQSGNAFDYAQATGASQPAFGATDGPNGTPALTFDGTDDSLVAAGFNLPQAGTTPTWIWAIIKQVTHVSGRRIWCASSLTTRLALSQNGASPAVDQFNGLTANSNVDLVVGSWCALQAYYSASVADFVQVNDAASVTGASAGNNSAATGRTLGGAAASLFSNIAVAEIVYADVLPSAGQLSAFAAYRLARYGF